jgi:rRNA-processing protein FCF1
MSMKRVVVDTNFMLIPFYFNVDVFDQIFSLLDEPFKIVIGTNVLAELEKLKKGKGKAASGAAIALAFIEKYKKFVEVVEGRGPVDNWIIRYAKENNGIVCTNDARLRERAKANGLSVIVLKGKARIDFA